VLEYFGDQDWIDRDRQCGACDNCDAIAHGRPTAAAQLSESEQKAVRSLLLLVGSITGRFGRNRICELALGTDEDARFDDLPERGALRGWKKNQLMDLLRSLEGVGLIEASRGQYPTLSTTRRGDQVAVGRIDASELGLQLPTISAAKSSKKRPRFRRS